MLEIACRADRQIDFSVFTISEITDISLWANDLDYQLWPA
jgi:hypothetical protein